MRLKNVKFRATRKDENGNIIPEFSIGNQRFALQAHGNKKDAQWMHRMLRKAFKTLIDSNHTKATRLRSYIVSTKRSGKQRKAD